ncbi:hypothetical protein [Microbispora sp. GKU 823]|uniref:hypothetical protein n=1 Tax=Microbispora sp. GKU 823 TaxID=1652100 RepID=UPI0009A43B42|nr:hypothetical protein [Microbispora sp. GKU 823]OPG12524.1 hypothetical protein B1L11_14165 [Microbispora sp. GKU 823]
MKRILLQFLGFLATAVLAVFAAVLMERNGVDAALWLPFLANGVLVLIVAVFTARPDRQRMRSARENPGERLSRRIERVNSAFTEAAALMDELRRDLEAQQDARDALLAEGQRQQELLSINKEEAERIDKYLTRRDRDKERKSLYQQVGFFVAGLLASVPLNLLSNWLSH